MPLREVIMVSHFTFQSCEFTLQTIVCIWDTRFRIIILLPQICYVALQAQISTPNPPVDIVTLVCLGVNGTLFDN